MEEQVVQQEVQQILTKKSVTVKKNQKVPKEFMQTKDDWVKKYNTIFKGSGFASEVDIPEEASEEQIKSATQLVSGKKVGTMEMIKAKREYREKRKKAQDHLAIVNAYFDKIDVEEKAIQVEEAHELRDEWDLMKVLDTQEEKQAFMEDVTSSDKERTLAAMDKAFEKLRTVDLKMFTVKTVDDLYKNFEQKRRYIEAGHILSNMIKKYISLGGVMDNARYVEMLALADFMEQQEIMYLYNNNTLLHPQNMLIREKELKNLTVEQLNEKADKLNNMIAEKKKVEGNSPEVQRLENLKTYIFNLSCEKLRVRDDRKKLTPKIGENMGEHFKLLKKQRQKINHVQWMENLKGFTEGCEKRNKRMLKYYKPGTFEMKNKDAKLWSGAGLLDRDGTRTSILELAYLQRNQKTLADLDDPENEPQLQEIKNKVDKVLLEQKEEELTNLFADMVRGFIRQFSVVEGKAMYTQFTGIGKMADSSLTTTVKGWGDKAAKNYHIGVLAADLYQFSVLNENVTRGALSQLTKEEIALYREAMCYADNVGGILQTFYKQLNGANLSKPESITEETAGGLMDGENKTVEQQFAQLTTIYLGSFQKEEDKLIDDAKKTVTVEKEGKKTKVPAAGPWKLITGGGSYVQTTALVGEKADAIIKYVRSDQAKQDFQGELDLKVNSDMLIDTNAVKIRLTKEGTVEPPAN